MTRLTKRQHEFLVLSDAAYQKKDYEKEATALGWKKLVRYSNGEVNVYVRRNQCVVAFRGTQSGKDFATDMKAIALSGAKADDRRFKEAVMAMRTVVKNIGEHYKISVTGHSLGGTIAQYIGRLFCIGGICFNPGSSPVGRLTEVMKKAAQQGMKRMKVKNCTRVLIVRVTDNKSAAGTDWISKNAEKNFPGSKTKRLPPKQKNKLTNLHLANHFSSAIY